MRRFRLYLDPAEFGPLASRIATASNQSGNNSLVEISGAPAHYLLSVLRARVGASLELFDGDGFNYDAVIETAGKRSAILRVTAERPAPLPSPCGITLAQAVSKGDRMDFVIQKATELGVLRIVPLLSARCDVKLDEDRKAKRLRHWQQIAVSAAEQSGRAELPEITAIVSLEGWLATRSRQASEPGFVLHPDMSSGLDPFHGIGSSCSAVSLLIGPEGGFEDAEIELAARSGLRYWQLGPRILRTETAPLAAITLLQWQFGDLRTPIHV